MSEERRIGMRKVGPWVYCGHGPEGLLWAAPSDIGNLVILRWVKLGWWPLIRVHETWVERDRLLNAIEKGVLK